jgi:hypothetical protein
MTTFTRTIEDFTCEHCGAQVKGNGYTNHCPRCLWSKHVDVNPGDRLNNCTGMMKPTAVDIEQGEHVLVFKCEKCGAQKRNKASEHDDFDDILKIMSQTANAS